MAAVDADGASSQLHALQDVLRFVERRPER
jgi:hypothetical protein